MNPKVLHMWLVLVLNVFCLPAPFLKNMKIFSFSCKKKEKKKSPVCFSESKADAEKKPKRRNSGRKHRRKKKISPAKDLTPNTAWHHEADAPETSWNNQNHLQKKYEEITKNNNENIGKNVNDLKNIKTSKRKQFDNFKPFEDREVYNVIDKLEKVSLKDDMYLAGDFNTDELENDFIYSSDDMDESFDDT